MKCANNCVAAYMEGKVKSMTWMLIINLIRQPTNFTYNYKSRIQISCT